LHLVTRTRPVQVIRRTVAWQYSRTTGFHLGHPQNAATVTENINILSTQTTPWREAAQTEGSMTDDSDDSITFDRGLAAKVLKYLADQGLIVDTGRLDLQGNTIWKTNPARWTDEDKIRKPN